MDAPLLVAVTHVATTAGYAGFQATIRQLVYPQLTGVPGPAFPAYEAAHSRRVSLVVGPLFAGLAGSTLALLVTDGVPRTAATTAAGLFAGLLGVTAFGAVPQHARLATGFDPAAYRRLLRWDSVRLVLAAAALGTALVTAAAVTSPAG